MNQNQRPVEKEYRSSQMYKTLTGAGIPAADKLAEGLGKAAAGLDNALNTVAPAVKSAAQSVRQAQSQAQQANRHSGPVKTTAAITILTAIRGRPRPQAGRPHRPSRPRLTRPRTTTHSRDSSSPCAQASPAGAGTTTYTPQRG